MAPSKKDPPGLSVRTKAAERLADVLAGQRFAPFAANEISDSRDRALANRLVTTALRRHGHLSLILSELLERGLPKKGGSFEAVLRISLAQLIFIPGLGAHSAPFLAVEAMKRDPQARHLAGLMNAVLRRAQANSLRYASLPPEQLFPDSVRKRWAQSYGDDLAAFGAALIDGAPLDLTLRDDDPELIEALGAVPATDGTVRLYDRDRPIEGLPGYAEGRWWVQDAAAAIPAQLLALPKGARVLDLCAAPGGKSAQLVKAGYAVTAIDTDAGRLERVESNLARLGYGAECVVADAATYRPEQPADGVLLDAPCSATGTFRRHPEVLLRVPDIAGRTLLQRSLITNAAACLAPGGILVYCVCSLEPEEGEAQARWIAEARPEVEAFPITAAELPGLEAAVTPEGWVRTHPGLALPGVEGTLDGFFVARFRKLP